MRAGRPVDELVVRSLLTAGRFAANPMGSTGARQSFDCRARSSTSATLAAPSGHFTCEPNTRREEVQQLFLATPLLKGQIAALRRVGRTACEMAPISGGCACFSGQSLENWHWQISSPQLLSPPKIP